MAMIYESYLRSQKLSIAFLGFCILSTGCSEDKWPGEVDVVPARGRLLAAGQPLAGSHITFHPINGAQKVKAQAIVGPDGAFVVCTFRSSDGAIPGEYTVTVAPNPYPDNDDGRYEQANVDLKAAALAVAAKIPKQYSDPKTSPLKVVIDKSNPELGQLEVK